jgi:tRNA dimethylallyltransferase
MNFPGNHHPMNIAHPTKLMVICGPTASGKSELALRLAHELSAEIINADSMQIYRGMDIGTAKPGIEERATVPHHLFDITDPDQPFSAADFADAADRIIHDINDRGKRVIVAGGTGLYIKALLKGLIDSPSGNETIRRELQADALELGNEAVLERLRRVDPDSAARMHPNNLVRIIRALEVYHQTGIPLSIYQEEHGFFVQRYQSMQIGIRIDRTFLYSRIDERVGRMLEQGLMQEVQQLLDRGYRPEAKAMRSIGYKEMTAHLTGEYSLDEAIRLIKRNTRHYAKRQMTWFNADKDILWFEYPSEFDTILQRAIDFFEQGER